MSRLIFIDEIRKYIGKPYLWGGSGPKGYDCSGLICACLNTSGYVINRTNVAGIAEYFKHCNVPKSEALIGTLFFYGKSIRPYHVMAVLEKWKNGHIILVGARGGDESTDSIEKATIQNAFVDVVDGNYWNGKFQFALDPFLKIN